jgi:hypothetical protein
VNKGKEKAEASIRRHYLSRADVAALCVVA